MMAMAMEMEVEMGMEMGMAMPLNKFDDTKDLYVDNILRAVCGAGGVKNRRPFATTLKCRAWNGCFCFFFFKGSADWLEGGADM